MQVQGEQRSTVIEKEEGRRCPPEATLLETVKREV
jgi:hypothetical protein